MIALSACLLRGLPRLCSLGGPAGLGAAPGRLAGRRPGAAGRLAGGPVLWRATAR